MNDHPSTDIVAAVLMAYLEENGIKFLQITDKELYKRLTKFKDDPKNLDAITRAMIKFREAQKE